MESETIDAKISSTGRKIMSENMKERQQKFFKMLFRYASTSLVISHLRIFGCIPGRCIFLLLCNICFFVKFTDLIFMIYEFDE